MVLRWFVSLYTEIKFFDIEGICSICCNLSIRSGSTGIVICFFLVMGKYVLFLSTIWLLFMRGS